MSSFTAEVSADHWSALYVNGELVGQDLFPIATERSFKAETITFEASHPLTVATTRALQGNKTVLAPGRRFATVYPDLDRLRE